MFNSIPGLHPWDASGILTLPTSHGSPDRTRCSLSSKTSRLTTTGLNKRQRLPLGLVISFTFFPPTDFKTEEELLSHIHENYQKTVAAGDTMLYSCARNTVSNIKAFLKSKGTKEVEEASLEVVVCHNYVAYLLGLAHVSWKMSLTQCTF